MGYVLKNVEVVCIILRVYAFRVWMIAKNVLAEIFAMNVFVDIYIMEFVYTSALSIPCLFIFNRNFLVDNVHQDALFAHQIWLACFVKLVIIWMAEHVRKIQNVNLENIMIMVFARVVLFIVLIAFPKISVFYAMIQSIFFCGHAMITVLMEHSHKYKQSMGLWIELVNNVHFHVWLAMEWIAFLVILEDI